MITIHVFSDYVSPYCFLLEKPLYEAVEGKDVKVEWTPFESRSEQPPSLLAEGEEVPSTWEKSIYPLAKQLGTEIRLPTVSPQPDTLLAFEGFHYANEQGKGRAYTEGVFRAFFQESLDIGKIEVLTQLAEKIGLDKDAFREALETRTYKEAHQKALKVAEAEGITSVPTIKIGNRTLVGLQTKEALEETITQASKPTLSFGDGAVCGPDGCFI